MLAGFFAISFLLSLSGAARAEEAMRVELLPKAQVGLGLPQLLVHADAPLRAVTLQLVRRSDGKKLEQRLPSLEAGATHRFPLKLERPGDEVFAGTLSARTGDGQRAELAVEVTASLLVPLLVTVEKSEVDLEAKALTVRANRPLARVELSVLGDAGGEPVSVEVPVSGPAEAGYRVSWTEAEGRTMRISVRGHDESGFYAGIDLFPWRVDIPHEEVNFRSGSAELDAAELPKLEASFGLLAEAVQKYGALAKIMLFVVGHTDTVGEGASNLALSDQRALAIGRWFKKRGLRIPIRSVGMGEEALLVHTPDATDEVRNRRAEYIVAIEPPALRGPARAWRVLD
jgi:outer membrane protein OmpA-like peptidoglycan-associated protein